MRLEVSAPDFSLRDTLESGQVFRWTSKHGASYGFLPLDRSAPSRLPPSCAVRVRQDDRTLLVESVDPRLRADHVRRYFALDVDLSAILTTIDVDPQMHAAISRHRGLRVIRQDSWECLASFILSSFNNIVRIQGMIERLAQAFGQPMSFNGFRGSSFPSPEALARVPERRLRLLGLGFRAPYLKATAKRIAEGRLPLHTLAQTDYWTTKASLLHCDGVGDKVADCVALFGFEKYEAFPIDVWIARAMRYYFRQARMTPARIHAFAHQHFGRYAGYAQQYLYHYVRTAKSNQQSATSSQPQTNTALSHSS